MEITKELITAQTKEYGIETSTSQQIIEAYAPFVEEMNQNYSEAIALNVADVNDTASMSRARELRLKFVKIRTSLDEKRTEIKKDSLLRTKAIDGMASFITLRIKETETHLKAQEEYAERIKTMELNEREAKRREVIAEYNPDTSFIDIRNMNDDAFLSYVDSLETVRKAKIAEEKRIQEEKEEVRKKEEERIKKMEEDNKKLRAEQAKKAKEQEALRKEIAEKEAEANRLRKEKEEAEEAERKKIQQAQEEERKAKEQALKEEERVKNLSTKEHLKVLHQWLVSLHAPEFPDDEKYMGYYTKITEQVEKIAERVNELATNEE